MITGGPGYSAVWEYYKPSSAIPAAAVLSPRPPRSTIDSHPTLRLRLLTTQFSQRGLPYRVQTAITPIDNPPVAYLESLTWYDEVGREVGTWTPNSPAMKTSYDGLGRPLVTYTTDRKGGTSFDKVYDPSTHRAVVQDDRVIEEREYRFVTSSDGDGPHVGSLDLITTRRRTSAAGGSTGALETLPAEAHIRTYVGQFYDTADRLIRRANYGANAMELDESGNPVPSDDFRHDGTPPVIDQGAPPDWDTTDLEIVVHTRYNLLSARPAGHFDGIP